MPKRVLVIDDEADIREMTRLVLEAGGYEVGEAGSGVETFAVVDSNTPANGRLTLKGVEQEALVQARKEVGT